MDNITIHAEHVTLNLHPQPEANSGRPVVAPLKVNVDRNAVAELVSEAVTQAKAQATGARFSKVLADDTEVSAEDPRDTHVAVIDHHAGLMWSVESLGDPNDEDSGMSQDKCVELAREYTLLGYEDWFLPTRAQLASLVDDTRHEPAIDTNLFPRVKPRWHWTSTPCAWSSASAWLGFYGGSVGDSHRYGSGFALAVRRVGQ
ncbi:MULTISPECIES: DUF1566 domain-containing protein [unclassified Pseudoxanthomonas]|uniref:Lcl C-terminal domain-containing protein n=1 Tax=unclassified Pseudoxanthomonas TaxID=2645906 RepID=UPI00307EE6F3